MSDLFTAKSIKAAMVLASLDASFKRSGTISSRNLVSTLEGLPWGWSSAENSHRKAKSS